MSIQDNKQTVREYLAHFKRAAVPDLMEAMSEDATWWILGKPHLFASAGIKSKADMERIWRGLFSHMKDGLEMRVIGMIAEDDKVAVEIRSHADLTDGRVYENQYHMLFTVQRGKVVEVREYADTLLIANMFGRQSSPSPEEGRTEMNLLDRIEPVATSERLAGGTLALRRSTPLRG